MNAKNSFVTVAGGILAVAFVCLCLAGMLLVNVNNTAVTLDENIKQQWSQVGVALQRRVDLYQSLTAITKGGAAQDLAIFQTLRDQAAALAGTMKYDPQGNVLPPANDVEAQQLAGALTGYNTALNNVVVYLADNPDQVASIDLFKNFQVQVEGTENRISTERRRYNEMVGDARRFCRTFPNSLICGIFGFDPSDWIYFQPDADSLDNPTIDFGQPEN